MNAKFNLLVLLFVAIMQSAPAGAPRYAGGPYFFRKSILVPGFPRPKDPIEGVEAEALKKGVSRSAYVTAYYSPTGLLESLEKHFEGKRQWKYVYTYEKDEVVLIEEIAANDSAKPYFKRNSKR